MQISLRLILIGHLLLLIEPHLKIRPALKVRLQAHEALLEEDLSVGDRVSGSLRHSVGFTAGGHSLFA